MKFNYAARMQQLKEGAAKAGLDAFLVTQKDSIYYLTGASYKPLERPFFILVRPEGDPDLLVPELEREHMRKAEGFRDVQAYFDYPSLPGQNWYDRLNEMLSGIQVVGLEPNVPVEIAQAVADKDIVLSSLIDEMRLVKTEEEIEAIRYASYYADRGMQCLAANLYRGVSVVELFSLARSIQTEILKTGDYDPLESEFLTVGWPAPKSAQPHSVPDLADRLGEGPISLMSFLRINGYAAECERTVFLGNPTERETELFMHMQKAREIAFSMVKPGASCSEIDAATQEYFSSVGLLSNILHRTGHGIGLGNHEPPYLSAGSDTVLQKNMVISIEPAVYLLELGGFRHSDTVLVTETGYECLTVFPTEIDMLTLRPSRPLKAFKGSLIRNALKMK